MKVVLRTLCGCTRELDEGLSIHHGMRRKREIQVCISTGSHAREDQSAPPVYRTFQLAEIETSPHYGPSAAALMTAWDDDSIELLVPDDTTLTYQEVTEEWRASNGVVRKLPTWPTVGEHKETR